MFNKKSPVHSKFGKSKVCGASPKARKPARNCFRQKPRPLGARKSPARPARRPRKALLAHHYLSDAHKCPPGHICGHGGEVIKNSSGSLQGRSMYCMYSSVGVCVALIISTKSGWLISAIMGLDGVRVVLPT